MLLGRLLLLGGIVALLLRPGIVPAAPAANPVVMATLTSFGEVPTLSTRGRGEFRAKILPSKIEFKITYRDLEGAGATVAHIHLGRPGVNGGVIAVLCGGESRSACPVSGTFSGILGPNDVIGPSGQGIEEGEFQEAVRAMLDGATYINVHSNAYRSGEVRGQVVPVAGP